MGFISTVLNGTMSSSPPHSLPTPRKPRAIKYCTVYVYNLATVRRMYINYCAVR